MNDPVAVVDAEYRFSWVNAAMESFRARGEIGRQPDALLRKVRRALDGSPEEKRPPR